MEIPKNLTTQELQDWLEANADSSKMDTYFRPFEQSELDEARTKYAEFSTDMEDVLEQFKEEAKAMKAELKSRRNRLNAVLKTIRRKGIEETATVYVIKNFENQTISTYSRLGTIINQRRMTPEERQLTIDTPLRKIGGQ